MGLRRAVRYKDNASVPRCCTDPPVSAARSRRLLCDTDVISLHSFSPAGGAQAAAGFTCVAAVPLFVEFDHDTRGRAYSGPVRKTSPSKS